MTIISVIFAMLLVVNGVYAEQRADLEISTSFNQITNWNGGRHYSCIDSILKLELKDCSYDNVDFELAGNELVSVFVDDKPVDFLVDGKIPIEDYRYYDDSDIIERITVPVKKGNSTIVLTTRRGSISKREFNVWRINYTRTATFSAIKRQTVNSKGAISIYFPIPLIQINSIKYSLYGPNDIFFTAVSSYTRYISKPFFNLGATKLTSNLGGFGFGFFKIFPLIIIIIGLFVFNFFLCKYGKNYFLRVIKFPFYVFAKNWGKIIFIFFIMFFTGGYISCIRYAYHNFYDECFRSQEKYMEANDKAPEKMKGNFQKLYENGYVKSLSDCADFGFYFINKNNKIECTRHGVKDEISRNEDSYCNEAIKKYKLLPYQISHSSTWNSWSKYAEFKQPMRISNSYLRYGERKTNQVEKINNEVIISYLGHGTAFWGMFALIFIYCFFFVLPYCQIKYEKNVENGLQIFFYFLMFVAFVLVH